MTVNLMREGLELATLNLDEIEPISNVSFDSLLADQP